MFQSLNAKIVASSILVVVLSVSLSIYLSGRLITNNYHESVQKQLKAAAASLLSLGISDFSELSDFEKMNTFIEESLQLDRVHTIVRIFDHQQKLIYTTVGIKQDPFPQRLQMDLKLPSFVELSVENHSYESLVVSYTARKKQNYLQLIIPLAQTREIMTTFWWQSLIVMALLLVISLVISRSITRRILRPVEDIASFLNRLNTDQVLQWTPLALKASGAYIEPIAKGINALVEQIKSLVHGLHKMSQFVAHELRTPLTIVQGEAETILMKKDPEKAELIRVLYSSLEETQRMSDIVTTVLQVGEQSGPNIHLKPEPIDIPDWVQTHLPEWERTLGAKIKLVIAVDTTGAWTVKEPKLLSRLLDNLVRNIREHASPGLWCEIQVTVAEQKLCFSVLDNGRGMDAKMLGQINSGRDVHGVEGVGLFLCRRIAELCGYGLRFSPRPEGGLCVTITLT